MCRELALRPIRLADEMDNVKPMLGVKKRHEETEDATNGRGGNCLGQVRKDKAFLLAAL